MPNKLVPKKGKWVFIKQSIPSTIPVHCFALYFAVPTGKYRFQGESHVTSAFRQIFYEHPYTGADMYEPISLFGNEEGVKYAIINYLRNKNFEMTPAQRQWFETQYSEEDYPIESQVKIQTEYGGVVLEPNEYNIASKGLVEELIQNTDKKHAFIQYLSDNKQLKGKAADQIFYLRTRGIGLNEALKMCIGQVQTPNLFYIFMHPGYVIHFDRNASVYFQKHLNAMDYYLPGMGATYLNLIKEVPGWEDFEVAYEEPVFSINNQ